MRDGQLQIGIDFLIPGQHKKFPISRLCGRGDEMKSVLPQQHQFCCAKCCATASKQRELMRPQTRKTYQRTRSVVRIELAGYSRCTLYLRSIHIASHYH